jgi:hypothetical protein
MYFLDDSFSDGTYGGLAWFSEPSDADLFQKSKAAIEAALKINPFGGYVAGSAAGKALGDAFESVPKCSAIDLEKELKLGQTPLAKLFGRRLADPTQRRLINGLKRKTADCLAQQLREREQLAAELKRKEDEQRRLHEQVTRALCANQEKTERLIDELCRSMGEGAPECKQQRANAAKDREENRRLGFRCN